MTVRHQLAVIGMLADKSRGGVGVRVRPEVLQDLEMRIARARTALDHGPAKPLPSIARTQASPDLIALAQAEEKTVRDLARKRARRDRGAPAGGSKPSKAGPKPDPKAAPKAAPKVAPKARTGKPARAPKVPKAAAKAKPKASPRKGRRA